MVLLCIYRPPGERNISKFLESLHNILITLAAYRNIFLTGDINIDISTSDTRAENYPNLLASHGLLPAHCIPTHSQTCLDHVLLKAKLSVTILVALTTVTDHYSIIMSFTFEPLSQSFKNTHRLFISR